MKKGPFKKGVLTHEHGICSLVTSKYVFLTFGLETHLLLQLRRLPLLVPTTLSLFYLDRGFRNLRERKRKKNVLEKTDFGDLCFCLAFSHKAFRCFLPVTKEMAWASKRKYSICT